MLTAGDDYPLHQRSEPIAFAGTDRNFYDRYFFNGQSADGQLFFAAALGVYPHLNVIDAAFSVLSEGVQRSVFASRILHYERMATRVGPIAVDVVEPLKRLRVHLALTEGISADLLATGLHPPIEEPRFFRRVGTRTLMDVTRMTQNVRWEGAVTVEGKARDVHGSIGTRDRSWGVRPIGAADPQPHAPAMEPQFFWLWAPVQFGGQSLFAHTNEDGEGQPWNRAAALVDHASGRTLALRAPRFELRLAPGTRRAAACVLHASLPDGRALEVRLQPETHFQMSGLGYGHPTRGHGSFHGELSVCCERIETAAIDPAVPANAHVQALVRAELHQEGQPILHGRGVLEQLLIGPHRPTGLGGLFDLA
ncbi:hypothetical protein [Thermaurantiacus sp.]